MTPDFKDSFNVPIYDAAADWLIEIREGEIDDRTRQRLDAWFRASPEHIRAYLELSAIWEDGTDPHLDRAHNIDKLIALARQASNVVSLTAADAPPGNANESSALPLARTREPASQVSQGRHTRRHRMFWRPALSAAALLACVLCVASLYRHNQRNLTLATDTGEQRFVKLVDGSTLDLNSHSRVRIRFSDHERDVDLIEGQALFHVAKDPSRPFIVHSGSTLVRAVGTKFDVYRKASGTTVTVVEGRVAVLSPVLEQATHLTSPLGGEVPTQTAVSGATRAKGAGPAMQRSLTQRPQLSAPADMTPSNPDHAIFLSAGEQITVGAQTVVRPAHTDTSAATAWTQHELVFDSTPLSDVAQEFNRYNTRQLIITDALLRDFHITGVFSSADPASLLRFLRAQHDITVLETTEDVRISNK